MKIGQTQCPSSSYGINDFFDSIMAIVSEREKGMGGWMEGRRERERESLWRQRYAAVVHF